MRIAILNADYEPFLAWLYGSRPGLEDASYGKQQAARNRSLFGVADFYSRNLRALGHEAWDLHANNPWMQTAWARERGWVPSPSALMRWRIVRPAELFRSARGAQGRGRGVARTFRRSFRARDDLHLILRRQIEELEPDVIWNQAMDWVSSALLRSVRSRTRLVVGQVAAPLPERLDLGPYDVVLSSLPHFVERFRGAGTPAHYQPLGFDPSVLDVVPEGERDLPFTFVGSVSESHRARTELLEFLCEQTPLQVWGALSPTLPASSPIRSRHRGPVWGAEMYRILRRSQLTLNAHIDVAAGFANNMRLFEATGVGTPLLTDRQRNLDDLFVPGDEVAVYGSPQECAAEASRLLSQPDRRRALGRNGQDRALRDHTYADRAAGFLDLVTSYL